MVRINYYTLRRLPMTETNQPKPTTPFLMMGFGGAGCAMAMMGLFVAYAQRTMMSGMKPAKPPPEFMQQYMQSIHGLLFDWFPLLMMLGVVWILVGFLLKNSDSYRPLAAIAILLAFVWITGYFYAASGPVVAVAQHFPMPGLQVYVPAMFFASSLMFYLIPASVAFLLKREYA